jgi:beta-lactamase class A
LVHSAELARLAEGAGLAAPRTAVSIVIRALDREGWSSLDAGVDIYPASMIKTPLAVAATLAIADGRLRWDEPLTVSTANMTPNDAPSPLVPGAHTTVRELVELMLARSDNVATNMLIDRLGRARATADLAALGCAGTAIRRKLSGALPLIDDPAASGRNVHPALEACELFRRIAHDDVPDAAFLRDVLGAQYWNTKLSCGLEPGDRFAHKTGDTDEVSHDGGILTLNSGQRYALAVYTTHPSNDATDRRFAAFMRALRPRLSATSGGAAWETQ